MSREMHTCPRRAEDGMDREDSPFVHAGKLCDTWDVREKNGLRKCSYCGSVHPADFLARLLAGDELGVTDKDYKAYLEGGPGLRKFYYQHMDANQRREFIDMLNARTVKIGYPGRFTVMPYFIKVQEPDE